MSPRRRIDGPSRRAGKLLEQVRARRAELPAPPPITSQQAVRLVAIVAGGPQ